MTKKSNQVAELEQVTQQLQSELITAKAVAFDKTTALEKQIQELQMTMQHLFNVAQVKSVDELLKVITGESQDESE